MLYFVTPGRLRLLLAVIVVLHHSIGFFAFGPLAVYLFFTLSGYWITVLYKNTYKQKPISTFWISRWWRLMPVLVSAMLLQWLCVIFFPAFYPAGLGEHFSTFSWWGRLLMGVGSSTIPSSLSVVWSLDVEFQFYLVFPFLAMVVMKPGLVSNTLFRNSLLGILFLGGMLSFLMGTSSTSPNVLQFAFFFVVGAFHALTPIIPINLKTLVRGALVFIAAVGLLAIVPFSRPLLTNYVGYYPAHYAILQNALMYALAVTLAPIALYSVTNPSSKLDRRIGDLAYPLYLLHMLPLGLYHQIQYGSAVKKLCYLLMAWLACALISLIVYYTIDRPSEFLRRKWLKGRS